MIGRKTMTDRYVGCLTAVLMATSILPDAADAATLTDETLPLPAPLLQQRRNLPLEHHRTPGIGMAGFAPRGKGGCGGM